MSYWHHDNATWRIRRDIAKLETVTGIGLELRPSPSINVVEIVDLVESWRLLLRVRKSLSGCPGLAVSP